MEAEQVIERTKNKQRNGGKHVATSIENGGG